MFYLSFAHGPTRTFTFLAAERISPSSVIQQSYSFDTGSGTLLLIMGRWLALPPPRILADTHSVRPEQPVRSSSDSIDSFPASCLSRGYSRFPARGEGGGKRGARRGTWYHATQVRKEL